MATITNLHVSCNSPRALGLAESGEYNDHGDSIVAAIEWKFSEPNPTTGPHELQLLQQECTVLSGVADNKRIPQSMYMVTKFVGKGGMTTLTKKK